MALPALRAWVSNWYYVSDRQRCGPVTDEEMHQLLLSDTIRADTLICKLGTEAWQPVAHVQDFESTLASLPPTWWYVSDGERKGPVRDKDLYLLLIGGTLTPLSLVWKEGMPDWQAAAQVGWLKGLPPALPSQPPPLGSSSCV
jgi:hypothetical protein